MSARVIRGVALAAIAAALAAWRFRSIVDCYFFSDDFFHLFDIVNSSFVDFVLRPFGAHSLVVSKTVMYAVYWICGSDARRTFVAVMLFHIANVLLFFRVLVVWLRSQCLACFGATLWGTAPVVAGTLGWYSVFGHVVLAALLLWLLLDIGRRWTDPAPVPARSLLLWGVIAAASTASFGIGVGIGFAIPALAIALFAPARLAKGAWWILSGTWVFLGFSYLALLGRHAGDYVGAVAHAHEMVLVPEPWPIAWATLALAAHGLHALVFDPFYLYDTQGRGFSLALVLGALSLLAWAAVRSGPELRRALIALSLLPLAGYLPIGLSKGGLIARLGAPLPILVSEPRYHYAMLIPMTLALCLALRRLGRALPYLARAAGLWLALCLSTIALLIAADEREIDHHDEARAETMAALADIRSSVEASAPGPGVVVADEPFMQLHHLFTYPGRSAIFLIHHPSGELAGRRVRFAVPASELPTAARWGGRIAEMLVPDERHARPRRSADAQPATDAVGSPAPSSRSPDR